MYDTYWKEEGECAYSEYVQKKNTETTEPLIQEEKEEE